MRQTGSRLFGFLFGEKKGLSEFPKSKLVEKAGHYELGCRCNPFPGGQVGIPPPSAYFPCKHGPAGFVKIAKRRMK